MSGSSNLHALAQEEWNDKDWEALLLAIWHKQCTPFLGAGACAGVLPLGREIAEAWALSCGYPFQDTKNLPKVAQYLSIEGGALTPKLYMRDIFAGKGPPDFNNPNETHRVLADLRLPIYITTNYDDYMLKALSHDFPKRNARREVCMWHTARSRKVQRARIRFTPTPEEPLVFHLHGVLEDIQSMVLTEDDYLDFLMYLSEDQYLLPPRITQAFSETSLLFMGYSLEDMNFKVLFRKLADYMRRNEGARHVSVQIEPGEKGSADEQIERSIKQRLYLEKHFDLQRVKVYWGTCEDFAAKLRTRWEAFKHAR